MNLHTIKYLLLLLIYGACKETPKYLTNTINISKQPQQHQLSLYGGNTQFSFYENNQGFKTHFVLRNDSLNYSILWTNNNKQISVYKEWNRGNNGAPSVEITQTTPQWWQFLIYIPNTVQFAKSEIELKLSTENQILTTQLVSEIFKNIKFRDNDLMDTCLYCCVRDTNKKLIPLSCNPCINLSCANTVPISITIHNLTFSNYQTLLQYLEWENNFYFQDTIYF